MLSDLRPLGLTDAARRLGIDPFEVVRLLVAADAVPSHAWQIEAETVDRLREIGGIEAPWWEGVDLPSDDNAARARIRGAIQQLVDRGHVGDDVTRMDNVWRGLPFDDQSLLQQAFMVLAEEGHVRCLASPVGLKVAIESKSLDTMKQIAAGQDASPGLAALVQG